MKVRAFAVLLALAAAAAPVAADPVPAADAVTVDAAAHAEGLWQGVIFYQRGTFEFLTYVELARDHEGALAGTIDLPRMNLEYLPLTAVATDGDQLSFTFSRYSPRAKIDVVSPIRGTISGDGVYFTGEYLEGGQNSYPIELRKLGPPGTERPKGTQRTLTVLSDDSRELRARFDADRDKVRAMLMVSPTCPLCLSKAEMLQRYLVEQIADPKMAIYLVWGPMQGNESESDARQATRVIGGPRVSHFWTPKHTIAEAYMAPLGLENDIEPAWDTYMLFPAGATWGETVPVPAYFMVEEKALLPAELTFNAVTFTTELKKLLAH